jgi:glutamate synthase domain-containing protein 2
MDICVDCLENTTNAHMCIDCEKSICERCWKFSIETNHDNKKHDIDLCEKCNLVKELCDEKTENVRLRQALTDLKELMQKHLKKQNDAIKKTQNK